MKEKIQNSIKDMSSKIERDSKHIYRNTENGMMYQGVSTVSSIVPKDWLSAWGAKEAVKFLGFSDYAEDTKTAIEMLSKIKMCDLQDYLKLLKEAKGASMRKSKQALVDGKAGHLWLELHVQAKIDGTAGPMIPVNTPLERPLRQFLAWELNEVQEWYASEALVCNPFRSYAGQLDAIYMSKANELTLCDFKFASHVSEDYSLQTAGYTACFELYAIEFDKRMIIRLPKTLEQDSWDPKTFKYSKVSNDIEAHRIMTPYERDREAFYAALVVKSWINFATKKVDN